MPRNTYELCNQFWAPTAGSQHFLRSHCSAVTGDRGWLGIKALCPAYLLVSCLSQPGFAPYKGCSSRSKVKPEFPLSNPLSFELPVQAARRSTRKQTLMFHSDHTPAGAGRDPGDARTCCSVTPGQGSHLAARQRACPHRSTVMGSRSRHSFCTIGSDLASDTRCSVG